MLNLRQIQTISIAVSARPLSISFKRTADGTGLPIGVWDWHDGAVV